jgi:hypothetical protein
VRARRAVAWRAQPPSGAAAGLRAACIMVHKSERPEEKLRGRQAKQANHVSAL